MSDCGQAQYIIAGLLFSEISHPFFIASHDRKRSFNLNTQVAVDHEAERIHIKSLRQETTSRDPKNLLVQIQSGLRAGVIINPGDAMQAFHTGRAVWSLLCLDFLSALALLFKIKDGRQEL